MKSSKFIYVLLSILVLSNWSCTQDEIVAENYVSFDSVNNTIEIPASGNGEGIVMVYSSFVASNDTSLSVNVIDANNITEDQYSISANLFIPAGSNSGELRIDFSNVDLSASPSLTLSFEDTLGLNFGPGATFSLIQECPDTNIFVLITFDDYSEETSWEIYRQGEANAIFSNSYGNGLTSTNERYCLPAGEYLFIINDAFGDGMCCDWGEGSYNIILGDGTVVASGGEFATSESSTFTVN